MLSSFSDMIFVGSCNPPIPTSIILKSEIFLENSSKAHAVINSKKDNSWSEQKWEQFSITKDNKLSSIILSLIINLSLIFNKWGEVKTFDVNWLKVKQDLKNSIVEPLPFVPATWIIFFNFFEGD